LTEKQLKHNVGDLFWINNTNIPNMTHVNLAAGLSNDRVCFKGVTKTGVSELMAVHHRNPQSSYKLTSAMVGIVTDAVVRKQKKTENYKEGVKNLFNSLWTSFSTFQAQREPQL
jgi:5-methylcytosine-specific restriction endonuclease McrBC regulatory subunit McrC